MKIETGRGRDPVRGAPRPDPGQPGQPASSATATTRTGGTSCRPSRSPTRPASAGGSATRGPATPTSPAPSSTAPTTCATCSSARAPARRPPAWPPAPWPAPCCARPGIEVRSHVVRIGAAALPATPPPRGTRSTRVEESPVRCVDAAAGAAMIAEIDRAKKDGDSVGGVVEVVARGVPAGPRLLRPVGPPARRPDRPGADVDPRGQGGRDRRGLRRRARRRGSAFHDEILWDAASRARAGRRNRAGGLEGGVTQRRGDPRARRGQADPHAAHRRCARSTSRTQGAAEGLGRAQRHLRGAGGRGGGRGHARPGAGRRAAREDGRRLARRGARAPRGDAVAAARLAGPR